ncbi:MAG TPA: glycoside hydrolase family 3 N-terminal domain-containing protein [Gaiellaceae bacterium]
MAPLRGAPSASLLSRVAAGQVGGVILLGNGWTSVGAVRAAVDRLQAVACRNGSPLLVGVDQEGGTVRRFPWAAPNESAAAMQTATVARAQAAETAVSLHRAGARIDFAPVSDTISTPRSFLGTRSFGSDPIVVAQLASAFVTGLQTGGVAATAKHFPGLGSAVASTDDRPVTIARSAAFLTAGLAPFKAAIAAGTKLVMVSNASYPALDPSGMQAVFSHAIVTGLLRQQLGFDGVVVTDALDAGAVENVQHAPARALAAGVDLLLYSETGASEAGYASLVHDAAASATVRANIATANRRVAALKSWLAAHGGPLCKS